MHLNLNLFDYLFHILSTESWLDAFTSEITAAQLALDFVSKTTSRHMK